MRDRSLTIFQKGLLLIAVPLLLQIGLLVYLVSEQHHSIEQQTRALHSNDILEATDRLERSLLDAHSAIRSYALTSNTQFRAAYLKARERIPTSFDALSNLVENPEQQQRLKDVRGVLTSIEQRMEQIDRLMQAGQTEPVVQYLRQPEGMKPFLIVRDFIDKFRAAETKVGRRYVSSVRDAARRIVVVLSVGLALALLAGLVSLAIFSRHITWRLGRLGDNVELFLHGKPLPAPMRGTDEISRMDHIFQAMASSIAASAEKEQLYQRSLERRAEDLSNANQELHQKSDEIEMFVYSVSHDLRSPLVNLQGFSKELGLVSGDLKDLLRREEVPETVRREAAALISGDMAESLQFIQSGVTRLANIIDALLRLSRAGRVEYSPQITDLAGLVRSVAATLDGTRAQKGAAIIIGELPEAFIDPSAAEQVFANCLANALNYLDPERPGRIEIGSLPAAPGAGAITYFVKDNGLGIPEAYLPKVFMVFQRLHGNAAPGEGIGLALVRRVLERNGGRIWVESVPGEGSTFFVALPAASAGRKSASAEAKDDVSSD